MVSLPVRRRGSLRRVGVGAGRASPGRPRGFLSSALAAFGAVFAAGFTSSPGGGGGVASRRFCASISAWRLASSSAFKRLASSASRLAASASSFARTLSSSARRTASISARLRSSSSRTRAMSSARPRAFFSSSVSVRRTMPLRSFFGAGAGAFGAAGFGAAGFFTTVFGAGVATFFSSVAPAAAPPGAPAGLIVRFRFVSTTTDLERPCEMFWRTCPESTVRFRLRVFPPAGFRSPSSV